MKFGFTAPLVLSLSLTLVRAQEAPAEEPGPSIPGDVRQVVTGWGWKDGETEGDYRAVLIEQGWEHLTTRLRIDWLVSLQDARETRVVMSRFVPELSPWKWSADDLIFDSSPKRTLLIGTASGTRGGEELSFYLELGKPGEYRFHSSLSPDAPDENSGTESVANCPDHRRWTREYRNNFFGFTVQLPPGSVGTMNAGDCANNITPDTCFCTVDHGVLIALAATDPANLRSLTVDAGYATRPDDSPASWLRREAIRLQSQRKDVRMVSSGSAGIAGRRATRVAYRSIDVATGWEMYDEEYFLRGTGDLGRYTRYSVHLTTTKAHAAADRNLLRRIFASLSIRAVD